MYLLTLWDLNWLLRVAYWRCPRLHGIELHLEDNTHSRNALYPKMHEYIHIHTLNIYIYKYLYNYIYDHIHRCIQRTIRIPETPYALSSMAMLSSMYAYIYIYTHIVYKSILKYVYIYTYEYIYIDTCIRTYMSVLLLLAQVNYQHDCLPPSVLEPGRRPPLGPTLNPPQYDGRRYVNLLYTCIYICTYIYVYIYTFIYNIHINKYIYTYKYVYIFTFTLQVDFESSVLGQLSEHMV
jgi:hypothetical protein